MFQPVPVFVGLRYSLAREHSFFLSFITWVSLGGVALGVLALITVLSVMNGFESELRARLLSLSAHATLTAGGAPIADWLARPPRPLGGRARHFHRRRRPDRRLAGAARAAQGGAGPHRSCAISGYRRNAQPAAIDERS